MQTTIFIYGRHDSHKQAEIARYKYVSAMRVEDVMTWYKPWTWSRKAVLTTGVALGIAATILAQTFLKDISKAFEENPEAKKDPIYCALYNDSTRAFDYISHAEDAYKNEHATISDIRKAKSELMIVLGWLNDSTLSPEKIQYAISKGFIGDGDAETARVLKARTEALLQNLQRRESELENNAERTNM